MKLVFVDSFYWIARLDPGQHWHGKAREIQPRLMGVRLLTTYEVLSEVLAFYSRKGPILRRAAAEWIESVLSDPNITVVPQTKELFVAGFRLYKERLDKDWSLTDCISMVVMQRNGISDALTHDHHFIQAGFTILLQ